MKNQFGFFAFVQNENKYATEGAFLFDHLYKDILIRNLFNV